VTDVVLACPSPLAIWSSFPKLVCEAVVLSSSDIRAEFSIVGSALAHNAMGSGSSVLFAVAGEVVDVVVVDVEVPPTVGAHLKLELPQLVMGGLP
jgi:hypothetical protein